MELKTKFSIGEEVFFTQHGTGRDIILFATGKITGLELRIGEMSDGRGKTCSYGEPDVPVIDYYVGEKTQVINENCLFKTAEECKKGFIKMGESGIVR